MREVRFIDNSRDVVRDALEEILAEAESAKIAVAFARDSGLAELPVLRRFAEDGREMRFVAGLDFQLTDLDTLLHLNSTPHIEARVYWPPPSDTPRNFHPKVYLAKKGKDYYGLVGSSNFTGGGLKKNIEANILIRGTQADPAIGHLLRFYEDLWKSPFTLPISAEIQGTYHILQERRRRAELELFKEARYASAYRQLELAISETVASYSGLHGRRTWLMVTSPGNYILCQRGGIWGDERRARLSQIQPGDILVFYLSQVHQLGMLAIVTGPVFLDRTSYWPDRLYPHRIPFTSLAEPAVSLPFKPLVPRLKLFRDVALRNWGQVLQRAQIKLDPSDANEIRDAILQAAGLTKIA